MNVSQITFDWLEENKYPSVTDYCRYLVDNKDTLPDRIEVYRQGLLCLTVTDVKEAAKVMPKDCKWIKYDKTRRKGSREARTAI